MSEDTLYRGAHRYNLDDDSDIQALEAERDAELTKVAKQAVEDAEPKGAEEETFKKRYGDLRRHMQEVQRNHQQQINDLKRQIEDATRKEVKLPKTREELEAWCNEYPDVAAVMETIAAMKAEEKFKVAEERLKEVDNMKRQTAAERAAFELKRLHPDYEEISADPKFHEWAAEQPQYIQDALYNNDTDAKACARAIDLYKADMGLNRSKPKAKVDDAAASVTPRGTRTAEPDRQNGKEMIKESWIAKLSSKQYDMYEEEIMKARKENRIVYDLSGASM